MTDIVTKITTKLYFGYVFDDIVDALVYAPLVRMCTIAKCIVNVFQSIRLL